MLRILSLVGLNVAFVGCVFASAVVGGEYDKTLDLRYNMAHVNTPMEIHVMHVYADKAPTETVISEHQGKTIMGNDMITSPISVSIPAESEYTVFSIFIPETQLEYTCRDRDDDEVVEYEIDFVDLIGGPDSYDGCEISKQG